jgi:hypothetical protein
VAVSGSPSRRCTGRSIACTPRVWWSRPGEQIVDGRARRYWRITDPGRAAVTAEAERLRAAATVVERLVAVGPVS